MNGRSRFSGRWSTFVVGLFGVFLLLPPMASAQAEPAQREAEQERATETDDESGSHDMAPSQRGRLRIRGIVLTVIGLSLSGGGATLSAFGFDEQVHRGDEVMRPLSIVFLGLGIALTGVGVSDLITSFLEDDRDEQESTAFLRHRSRISLGLSFPWRLHL